MPICPECKTGKHPNCNGVGDIADDNTLIACRCTEGIHPHRGTFFLETPPTVSAD